MQKNVCSRALRGLRYCLLSLYIGMLLCAFWIDPAKAVETTVPVMTTNDVTSALAAANGGDTLTFVFQNDMTLIGSFWPSEPIVIPDGVTAVFTNASGNAVTVKRDYFAAASFVPMVTVKGKLVIREDASNGGSLTFDGENHDFKTAAMFSVTGELEMRSGTIRRAVAKNGGAIEGGATSAITIAGGEISECVGVDFGGAVSASGNLNISGGTFLQNDSGAGGAIYYNGSSATALHITGGSFTSNGNNNLFGGGALFIQTGFARITGGDFTQNSTLGWGGAIYIHDAEVSMARVLIHNNLATLEGGGIYNCGIGGGDYQRFCGMTLYHNEAFGEAAAAGDDFFSEKKTLANKSVFLSDYTLNGGLRSWYKDVAGGRYQAGDAPAQSSYYQNSSQRFALKGSATAADDLASAALAWVTFSGNTAGSGGAIANNGKLDIGYISALTIEKVINGKATNEPFVFEIALTDADGKPYTSSVFYELEGAEYRLDFDGMGKAALRLKGGQKATLYDIPLGFRYQIREWASTNYVLIEAANASGSIGADGNSAVFTNELKPVPTPFPFPTADNIPKTGDDTPLSMLWFLMGLALLAGSALFTRKATRR